MNHSYFVVMIEYPAHSDKYGLIRPACREAIVDPEMTYSNVVDRVRSGEYKNISFIHHITMDQTPDDVTDAVLDDAGVTYTGSSVLDRDARADA